MRTASKAWTLEEIEMKCVQLCGVIRQTGGRMAHLGEWLIRAKNQCKRQHRKWIPWLRNLGKKVGYKMRRLQIYSQMAKMKGRILRFFKAWRTIQSNAGNG